MSEIRWGVMGAGTIAYRFADALEHVGGARLVAVSGRNAALPRVGRTARAAPSTPPSTAQAAISCATAPGESAGPITGRDGAESRPAYALRCIPACPPGL